MVASDSKDFPRGGAQIISPLEARKIRNDAAKDILFKNDEPPKKKSKIKSKPSSEKAVIQREKTFQHFSFKYISKGLLILGYIKEVTKREYVVGLPNSLSGHMSFSMLQAFLNTHLDEDNDEGSVVASTLFKVGQLLPVCVADINSTLHGYKKLELTALPFDVNNSITRKGVQTGMLLWGVISSEEDHGYIISFGKGDMPGFVPKSDSKDLKCGQLRWFGVTKVSSKVLTCTSQHEKLTQMSPTEKLAHFNILTPGQYVGFTPQKDAENYSCGTIFGSFSAFVDKLHVPEEEQLKKKSKKVFGRIIHANNQSKQIGISLLPHTLPFPEDVVGFQTHVVGEVLENCSVVDCEQSSGILLQLTDTTRGHVHISRVDDKRVEKLGSKYKPGTQHKCRVLGYSAIDDVYTVTMKKSEIEKEYLSYDDVQPGTLLSGTVLTLEDFGCLIKITDHIRGLCPRMHLADIMLKHPEKKFVEGKKLRFKVLTCKPDEHSVILTHKKTLLDSDLPPILSIEDVKVGQTSHAFVSGVKSFGVFVKFYNDVKALIPKSEIRLAKDVSLENMFSKGQVLKVTIKSVDLSKQRIVATLLSGDVTKEPATTVHFGDIVSGKLTSYKEEVSLVKVSDNLNINMPLDHMSDFVELNNQWETLLQTASKNLSLGKLCLFSKNKKSGIYNASQKTVIANGFKPIKFDDLKIDMVFPGIVSHVMSYGLFVTIAPGVNGLVPNSHLADFYVADPSDYYSMSQSLLVKVIEIDVGKQRFLLSAKPSNMPTNDQQQHIVETYFQAQQQLFTACQFSKDEELKALPSLIGEVIIAKVVSNTKESTKLQYIDGVTTLTGYLSQNSDEVEVGVDCQCLVVDVNLTSKQFYAVTFKPALEAAISPVNLKWKKDIRLKATVVYTSNNLIGLVVEEKENSFVYAYAKSHLNDTRKNQLSVNSKVVVLFVGENEGRIFVKLVNESSEAPKIGNKISVVIKGIKPTQLNVSMSNERLKGRVHISNFCDSITEQGVETLKKFKPTEVLQATVIGFREIKTNNYLPISHKEIRKSIVELSLKSKVEAADYEDKEIKSYKIGETVACFITSVTKKSIWVSVHPKVKGKICMLNLTDDLKELKNWHKSFTPGKGYTAKVIAHGDDHLELSRIEGCKIKKGACVNGRISRVLKNVGVLVELGDGRAGVVHLTELNDTYATHPLEEYKPEQIVRVKVLTVKKDGQIDLSMRNSRISGEEVSSDENDISIDGYDDIKEGEIIRGYVKSCSKIGVFVSLSPTIVSRVQIKNLSQYFVKDFAKLFHVGKLVKGKILSIDPVTHFIDLSLRGKDVNDVDPAPKPEKREKKEDEAEEKDDIKMIDESDDEDVQELIIESDVDDRDDVMSEDDQEDKEKDASKQCLEIEGGFKWDDEMDDLKDGSDDESSADEEKETKENAKKSKRQKRALKKTEEEALHKAEMMMLDPSCQEADNTETFERLCLASPNSSIVWIQYIAYHLHSADVEKARQVARRALKTISFREEQEKLNVWVALLNLENNYGTSESTQAVLNEAAQANDAKKVYVKMLDILNRSNKVEEAEKLYQRTIKRFKSSKAVWISYGYFLMKNQKLEEARKLLQRCLTSLPQRKHIETIVQFALLEYKFGEAQRGATVMESVLNNYPKRCDLWSVYIDSTFKHTQDLEQVRNIFERVTSLSLSAKKMRFMFKRYIEFEEKHGSPSTVANAKQRLEDYIEANENDEDEM